MNSKILQAAALLLTAVIGFFHLYYISKAGGLWRDEANTAALASMPSISEIWAHLPFESFPMLWPLVVRSLQFLGAGSDFAFRVLGCSIGLSIVAVLWLNARWLKFSAPLVSLALLGFSPVVIRSGDSLRAYGLGVCLTLLTFGLVWKVATAASARTIILAALAAIASAQALYHNAVVLFAIGLAGAAVAARNRHWRRTLIILGIGGLAALSLLPYLDPIQRARSWDVVSMREFDLSIFWTRLFEALSGAGPVAGWIWIVLLVMASAVALLVQFGGSGSVENERRDLALYSLLALVISVAASFGFLKFVSYPTQPWYYLPLIGLLAIAIEGSLSTIPSHLIRDAARLLLTATVALVGAMPVWNALQMRQTNIDLIAQKLNETAATEDVIVIVPWYLGITFDRYYKGAAARATIPPVEDLRVQRYDVLKTQMENMDPIKPVLRAMEAALKSGRCVWIIGSLRFPPEGELPPLFAPAPYESFGWNEGAYMSSWNMQISYFLRHHALSAEKVELPTAQPISPYENPPLMAVRGWR
ncbi:MAG: hypothetical protein H0W20_15015 [Chthoniobacterales bacterium]|nr:hypothetical protein [Chthoniobacterales bacterium]MDQ3315644.1 hypothetical protein [Verrucomicrobiota bacterium]